MGAATLLIHMLANVATHMRTSRTTLGFDPAALRIRDAVMTSSRVLDKTAAIVKPPIRSMMVGENICEKMYLEFVSIRKIPRNAEFDAYLVASDAGNLVSASSDDRNTLSNTTRNGTASEVTKSGIAYPISRSFNRAGRD